MNSVTLSARTDHLVLYKNSIHDKIQCPCPGESCDAMFTQIGRVKRHVDGVHSSVHYPCPVKRL